MIVKGQAVKGAKRLATHLLKTENEVVNILHVDGIDSSLSPEALRQSLIDMEDLGKITNTQTGRVLYHANIDPRKHERLTPDQYIKSADMLMDKLGLSDQPCILVEHVKNGRQHAHLVVQLTDMERGTVKQLHNNFYKQTALARELEREFGLEITPQRKTGNSYDMTEAQQIKKQGKSVKEYRSFLSDSYQKAKNGKEFRKSLRQQGYVIAKGDRRGLIVLGKDGSPRSLTRDLKSTAKSTDIKTRLKDVIQLLPDVENAKRDIKSLQQQLNQKDLEQTQEKLNAQIQSEQSQKRDEFRNNFLAEIRKRDALKEKDHKRSL